ncbi:aldehyde dehydrogenase family protein, partial [Burkholderia sp. SIMBA_048]|uniref:aldehyde dehydrogenase family protein n=1 Tax=Burkholderia sp. SIMBA_048 TaxID=3085789 RepID=UPI003979EA78
GTERVYVERPLFDKVVDALTGIARALRPGVPEDPGANLGPLISREHLRKVLSYYALARDEGATIQCGGGVPEMPAHLREGAWIQPTIWTGLSRDSR